MQSGPYIIENSVVDIYWVFFNIGVPSNETNTRKPAGFSLLY